MGKLRPDDEDPCANFNAAATATPPPSETKDGKKKLGVYFPLPEIVPAAPKGTWRFLSQNNKLTLVVLGKEGGGHFP
ncbi:hypothetical protein POJ06DRAFT_286631 [Lipomyces tetrasporus]|uniref:Uncharacterized protein n=1 Tax=Lipomyces tetrasporus TaxID=54092 RepID=A0AAD7QKY6_9ASCO|nr:uncharacterized protein POJ06DRAFT_286631 [Lipomyces tetrasporus]KAJ8097190.1 hypothetical protein POJ06DRAFT_286631 [Lipomyces tetrasporus]